MIFYTYLVIAGLLFSLLVGNSVRWYISLGVGVSWPLIASIAIIGIIGLLVYWFAHKSDDWWNAVWSNS